ncbi:MAG: hypothetical protein AB1640_10100 [bacterium]
MSWTTNPADGFALMEDNELLIGQLYRQYAVKLPRQVRLWSGLARDEIQHAWLLRRLRSRLPAQRRHDDRDGIDAGSLCTFRDFMKGLLYSTLEKDPASESAIHSALYIQWSLLEQDFFQMSDEDPEEVRTVMQTLSAGTRRHRGRLLRALARNRKDSREARVGEDEAVAAERGFVLPRSCVEFNHLVFFPLEA